MEAIYAHLGAWPAILLAAIVLGGVFVGVPRAIVALMAWTEELGEWSCERVRQLERRLRERRSARSLKEEAAAPSPTKGP